MEQVTRVRIGEGGRLVIPATLRQRHGIKVGQDVILEEADGDLVVRSLQSALQKGMAEALAIMDQCIDPKVDLQDELKKLRQHQRASEDAPLGRS
ncbi:MAG: AbrB/MazE/SpoVT family DNA-binding domain-containing protein [Gemmatales bacterium]